MARSLVAVVHILPDRNPVVHHNPLDLVAVFVASLVEEVLMRLVGLKVVLPDIHRSSEEVVGHASVGLDDRILPLMLDLLGQRLEDQGVVVA